MLDRRKGDLRPNIVDITDLLTAYNKTEADIYDVLFQLFDRETKVLDKRFTDASSTLSINTIDGRTKVTVDWGSADFDNLTEKSYRLAIGVQFSAQEMEQNPDSYHIVNGKSLGEEPKYTIKNKATEL